MLTCTCTHTQRWIIHKLGKERAYTIKGGGGTKEKKHSCDNDRDSDRGRERHKKARP